MNIRHANLHPLDKKLLVTIIRGEGESFERWSVARALACGMCAPSCLHLDRVVNEHVRCHRISIDCDIYIYIRNDIVVKLT